MVVLRNNTRSNAPENETFLGLSLVPEHDAERIAALSTARMVRGTQGEGLGSGVRPGVGVASAAAFAAQLHFVGAVVEHSLCVCVCVCVWGCAGSAYKFII